MAALPLSASATHKSTPDWTHHLQTGLARLATAVAAVIGVSAMATQGAVGGHPGLINGTYLYGESPVANTAGAVYLVFRVANGTLTGAVYQPSSSFDCVYGTVTPEALDLTIVDAYDQTESDYSIALAPANAAVASAAGVTSVAQVEGMYAIRELSNLDQQLLATCANR